MAARLRIKMCIRDSAYIVLAIMKMPDTVLVAVIIGVTNVIPFFGPFIGAVPVSYTHLDVYKRQADGGSG